MQFEGLCVLGIALLLCAPSAPAPPAAAESITNQEIKMTAMRLLRIWDPPSSSEPTRLILFLRNQESPKASV